MNWCCLGFQAHFQVAGRRGLAALVDRKKQGELVFILQFRAVDLGTDFSSTEVPFTLCEDNRIQYCPWCGTHLSSFYQTIADQLIRPGLRTIIEGLD
jgi:hypothetical protein